MYQKDTVTGTRIIVQFAKHISMLIHFEELTNIGKKTQHNIVIVSMATITIPVRIKNKLWLPTFVHLTIHHVCFHKNLMNSFPTSGQFRSYFLLLLFITHTCTVHTKESVSAPSWVSRTDFWSVYIGSVEHRQQKQWGWLCLLSDFELQQPLR